MEATIKDGKIIIPIYYAVENSQLYFDMEQIEYQFLQMMILLKGNTIDEMDVDGKLQIKNFKNVQIYMATKHHIDKIKMAILI